MHGLDKGLWGVVTGAKYCKCSRRRETWEFGAYNGREVGTEVIDNVKTEGLVKTGEIIFSH